MWSLVKMSLIPLPNRVGVWSGGWLSHEGEDLVWLSLKSGIHAQSPKVDTDGQVSILVIF